MGTVIKWSNPLYWPYGLVVKPLWKAFSFVILMSWWKPQMISLKLLKLGWLFYVWIPGSLPLLAYGLGSTIGYGPQMETGMRWLWAKTSGALVDGLIALVDYLW